MKDLRNLEEAFAQLSMYDDPSPMQRGGLGKPSHTFSVLDRKRTRDAWGQGGSSRVSHIHSVHAHPPKKVRKVARNPVSNRSPATDNNPAPQYTGTLAYDKVKKHMRAFGLLAYVKYQPQGQLTKLEPRWSRMVFLGFAPQTPG